MSNYDFLTFLAFIGFVMISFNMIFWMITGWRAMRAHEKIADYIELLSKLNYKREQDTTTLKEE